MVSTIQSLKSKLKDLEMHGGKKGAGVISGKVDLSSNFFSRKFTSINLDHIAEEDGDDEERKDKEKANEESAKKVRKTTRGTGKIDHA